MESSSRHPQVVRPLYGLVDPDIHFSNLLRWPGRGRQLNSNDLGIGDERALEAIRRFILERGSIPTADSWQAASMRPCEKTIRRRFGSFKSAIARAGAL